MNMINIARSIYPKNSIKKNNCVSIEREKTSRALELNSKTINTYTPEFERMILKKVENRGMATKESIAKKYELPAKTIRYFENKHGIKDTVRDENKIKMEILRTMINEGKELTNKKWSHLIKVSVSTIARWRYIIDSDEKSRT